MPKSLSGLNGARKEYTIELHNTKYSHDVEGALSEVGKVIKEFLRDQFKYTKKLYKFQIIFKPLLKKYEFTNNRYHYLTPHLATEQISVITINDVHDVSIPQCKNILERFDAFIQFGSGWTLVNTNEISIIFHTYRAFKGGCTSAPALPKLLSSKKALTCVNNDDNKCFLYAVIAGLCATKKNPQRINSQYLQLLKHFEYVKINYPVGVKEIKSFEKQTGISINVYGYENKIICPQYVTSFKKTDRHVNLLLYKEHYYTIRNMSALICKQSKKNTKKLIVCDYCLSYFVSQEKYKFHQSLCQNNSQRFKMPDEDPVLKFTNFRNMIQAPFVVYADIESLCLEKEEVNKGKTISNSIHKPISVCAYLICRDNHKHSAKKPFLYTGKDCIVKLFEYLVSEIYRVKSILENKTYALNMTDESEEIHRAADKCKFCKKKFKSEKKKCRDHNHLIKKDNYRQTLCNTCNLTYASMREEIYVIFHGLSNYDSHFLVKELHMINDRFLKIIPKNTEKFLSFSIYNMHFKDSAGFLPTSLAELVRTLKDKGRNHFNCVSELIQDEEKRECLYQKGIFPYSWFNHKDKLKFETLPEKSDFFNDLSNEDISDEEYAFATKVWKLFDCKNMKDYMEIYLLADVLLLADVFENYRTRCLLDYELDPLHYFSAAHFSFDAYLRMSDANLDLFQDINQYLFISEGIRGGLSFISQRHSKANNKYMDSFDPGKPSKYIIYIDCNNLYGLAMLQSLPYKDFEWVEIDLDSVLKTYDHSEYGYILQVDLEYPEYLHSSHSDYPLAPEKRKINKEMISPFAKYISSKNDLKIVNNVEKLVTTFLRKDNYILHYRLLKLYLSLGLKVVNNKIKRALKFKQKTIMKDFIDFNSAKRSQSTNTFDSNYFKAMNNSTFGKTMERTDNRTICKLANNLKTFEKYVAKPTFKNSSQINSKLIALNMKYPCIKLNKPIFLGFTILEISKHKMFDFHYNVIKNKYGDKAKLLFTDTDSLMYEIETEDVYQDFKQLNAHFDFSNYPKEHHLYSVENKKIPGFFKDEAGGEIIEEFVGLKSKMYAYKTHKRQKENKSAKGVKKSVIDKSLSFQDYRNVLLNCETLEHDYMRIASKTHNVSTRHESKRSLNPYDDKRYLLDHKYTLPYGHHQIK